MIINHHQLSWMDDPIVINYPGNDKSTMFFIRQLGGSMSTATPSMACGVHTNRHRGLGTMRCSAHALGGGWPVVGALPTKQLNGMVWLRIATTKIHRGESTWLFLWGLRRFPNQGALANQWLLWDSWMLVPWTPTLWCCGWLTWTMI